GGREHADRAILAAKDAHADGRWRRTPPAQRAAVLDAIADRLTERINELAVLEALENGAPVRQAGAFQIGFSIAHLRYFADHARGYGFERPGHAGASQTAFPTPPLPSSAARPRGSAFERPGPLLRVPPLASATGRREP